MQWNEWLTATNTLVGLILALVAAGAGVIGWLYRRMRSIAREANPVDLDTARRVQHIEQELGVVRGDLTKQGARLSDVERRLETVATQRDLLPLVQGMSELKAQARMTQGMTDTLYKAVLSASGTKGKDQ